MVCAFHLMIKRVVADFVLAEINIIYFFLKTKIPASSIYIESEIILSLASLLRYIERR